MRRSLRAVVWASLLVVACSDFAAYPRNYVNSTSTSTLSLSFGPIPTKVIPAPDAETVPLQSSSVSRPTKVVEQSSPVPYMSTSDAGYESSSRQESQETSPPANRPVTTVESEAKESTGNTGGDFNTADMGVGFQTPCSTQQAAGFPMDSQQVHFPTPLPTSFTSSQRSPQYPKYQNTTCFTCSFVTTPKCTVLSIDQDPTIWIILPNPATVTLTVGNYNTRPKIPEFTPPVYCGTHPAFSPALPELPSTATHVLIGTSSITTFITTSKNPVTVYTTPTPPRFPGKTDKETKETVRPSLGPIQPPNFPQDPSPHFQDPTTIAPHILDGGSSGSPPHPGPGEVQVLPETTVPPKPLPTNVVVLDGEVISAVKSTIAVFDGTTVIYGDRPAFTTKVHGESLTLGNAITYATTTLGGSANTETQLGIVGGITVSQIGSSVAEISSTSLFVGPNAQPTTVIIQTYTITANSDGLGVAGTTLSYPFNPSPGTITMWGITFSQIGSTIILVDGSTFAVGKGSTPTSTVFNGQTISFGPDGIGLATTSSSSSRTQGDLTPTQTRPLSTGADKDSKANILKPVFSVLGSPVIFGYILLL